MVLQQQICRSQPFQQLTEPVTTLVMADLVPGSPRAGEMRERSQQGATPLENAADFAHTRDVILHVLNYIGREDQIEPLIRKW